MFRNSAPRGLGLIDFMSGDWENDQDIFEPGFGLEKDEIEELNRRFVGFGIMRGSWGFEAADYFYMNKDGMCGSIYFHQDGSDTLQNLKKLLKDGPAGGPLEDFLPPILRALAEDKIKDEL